MKEFKLNDGNIIPAIGFGVFRIDPNGPTYEATLAALEAGYRHIDTAAAYYNEEDVGRAVRDSGIPREEVFVTSKLWLSDYGEEGAKRGVERSLRKLGLDYVDLYLMHQPYGDYLGAWKALVDYREQGVFRSIGVSNMSPNIWRNFRAQVDFIPAVNQVNCNPLFQQRELRKLLAADGVLVEAWGPLGQGNVDLLQSPVLAGIAEAHGKNVGQVMLRFENQEGIVALPKSTNPARIASNLDIFDFELTPEEIDAIRAMDTGRGHDPETPGLGEMLMKNYVIED